MIQRAIADTLREIPKHNTQNFMINATSGKIT